MESSEVNPTMESSEVNPTMESSEVNPTRESSEVNPTMESSEVNPTMESSEVNPTMESSDQVNAFETAVLDELPNTMRFGRKRKRELQEKSNFEMCKHCLNMINQSQVVNPTSSNESEILAQKKKELEFYKKYLRKVGCHMNQMKLRFTKKVQFETDISKTNDSYEITCRSKVRNSITAIESPLQASSFGNDDINRTESHKKSSFRKYRRGKKKYPRMADCRIIRSIQNKGNQGMRDKKLRQKEYEEAVKIQPHRACKKVKTDIDNRMSLPETESVNFEDGINDENHTTSTTSKSSVISPTNNSYEITYSSEVNGFFVATDCPIQTSSLGSDDISRTNSHKKNSRKKCRRRKGNSPKITDRSITKCSQKAGKQEKRGKKFGPKVFTTPVTIQPHGACTKTETDITNRKSLFEEESDNLKGGSNDENQTTATTSKSTVILPTHISYKIAYRSKVKSSLVASDCPMQTSSFGSDDDINRTNIPKKSSSKICRQRKKKSPRNIDCSIIGRSQKAGKQGTRGKKLHPKAFIEPATIVPYGACEETEMDITNRNSLFEKELGNLKGEVNDDNRSISTTSKSTFIPPTNNSYKISYSSKVKSSLVATDRPMQTSSFGSDDLNSTDIPQKCSPRKKKSPRITDCRIKRNSQKAGKQPTWDKKLRSKVFTEPVTIQPYKACKIIETDITNRESLPEEESGNLEGGINDENHTTSTTSKSTAISPTNNSYKMTYSSKVKSSLVATDRPMQTSSFGSDDLNSTDIPQKCSPRKKKSPRITDCRIKRNSQKAGKQPTWDKKLRSKVFTEPVTIQPYKACKIIETDITNRESLPEEESGNLEGGINDENHTTSTTSKSTVISPTNNSYKITYSSKVKSSLVATDRPMQTSSFGSDDLNSTDIPQKCSPRKKKSPRITDCRIKRNSQKAGKQPTWDKKLRSKVFTEPVTIQPYKACKIIETDITNRESLPEEESGNLEGGINDENHTTSTTSKSTVISPTNNSYKVTYSSKVKRSLVETDRPMQISSFGSDDLNSTDIPQKCSPRKKKYPRITDCRIKRNSQKAGKQPTWDKKLRSKVFTEPVTIQPYKACKIIETDITNRGSLPEEESGNLEGGINDENHTTSAKSKSTAISPTNNSYKITYSSKVKSSLVATDRPMQTSSFRNDVLNSTDIPQKCSPRKRKSPRITDCRIKRNSQKAGKQPTQDKQLRSKAFTEPVTIQPYKACKKMETDITNRKSLPEKESSNLKDEVNDDNRSSLTTSNSTVISPTNNSYKITCSSQVKDSIVADDRPLQTSSFGSDGINSTESHKKCRRRKKKSPRITHCRIKRNSQKAGKQGTRDKKLQSNVFTEPVTTQAYKECKNIESDITNRNSLPEKESGNLEGEINDENHTTSTTSTSTVMSPTDNSCKITYCSKAKSSLVATDCPIQTSSSGSNDINITDSHKKNSRNKRRRRKKNSSRRTKCRIKRISPKAENQGTRVKKLRPKVFSQPLRIQPDRACKRIEAYFTHRRSFPRKKSSKENGGVNDQNYSMIQIDECIERISRIEIRSPEYSNENYGILDNQNCNPEANCYLAQNERNYLLPEVDGNHEIGDNDASIFQVKSNVFQSKQMSEEFIEYDSK